MRPSHIFFFIGFLTFTVLQGQEYKHNRYIDSLINEIDHTPESVQKVRIYGRLYEKLMHRDQELSFAYAKKEYVLSKKLDV